MKTFFKPLLTIVVLAFAASAIAQTEVPDNLRVDDSAVPVKFDTNVYIVRMKGDPVLAYEGGNGKLKATKPGKGKKINPNSSAVKKYVAYLDSRHDDVMKAIGAGEKIYDYRYALNGFAAVLTPDQVEAVRQSQVGADMGPDLTALGLLIETCSDPAETDELVEAMIAATLPPDPDNPEDHPTWPPQLPTAN